MPVTAIQTLEEFKRIINEDQIVVIDFWAIWCGPCRAMSPVMDKISEDPNFVALKFCKVDIDEHPEIAKEVDVRSIPFFIVFKNGNKIDNLLGADPAGLQALVVKAADSKTV